jgi:hypothetical protein
MNELSSVRFAGLAALAAIAWALIMMYPEYNYPYPRKFNHGVKKPVIALEISRGEGDINAVLRRGSSQSDLAHRTMSQVNWLDLIFIPLYALSLWSTARLFTEHTSILTAGIVLTGIFDYLEDWRIYQALEGDNPPIYVFSVIKWALLGIVLLGLSWIFATTQSAIYSVRTKRLLATGYFGAGAVILTDAVFGGRIGYAHIALGVSIFGITMAVHAIGLNRDWLK